MPLMAMFYFSMQLMPCFKLFIVPIGVPNIVSVTITVKASSYFLVITHILAPTSQI